MTPEEKKAYKWKCYDETAKPKLLELIKHCQNGGRICPLPQHWNKIYHAYSWHTDRHKFTKFPPLKIPLILGAWNANDIDKRQRFLTQVYWCYENYFMGAMYDKIMRLTDDDWCLECFPEDKISLELIRRSMQDGLVLITTLSIIFGIIVLTTIRNKRKFRELKKYMMKEVISLMMKVQHQ